MKSKNGKIIQKISILAALVALIGMALAGSVMADTSTVVYGDSCYAYGDIVADGTIAEDDAIYLLYHSVFGEEAYPLTNYEKDGDIIGLDAIGLLAMKGQEAAHAYKDPIWQWTEDGEAKAVFHCACGKGDAIVKDATVIAKETKATCITEGIVEYKAEVTLLDNHTYTAEKTVQTSPATGVHSYDSEVVCMDRTCKTCGHEEAAAAHEYEVVKSTTATCTEAATKTYKCKSCNEATYEETIGLAAGHSYGTAVETLVAGCEYKEVYTCAECKATKDGEHYDKHEIVATIEDEATCSHEGTKVYTCKTCKKELKSETIAIVADAHTWNDGTENEDGTLIVYACKETGCTKTRTAINAAKKTEAKVDSTVLAETNEIDLNGTSLKLDEETANQLEGEVEIKADTTTAEDLGLSDDLKEQIGDNPVYDFSITDANGAVGKEDGSVAITISLPYELQEGDDVDSIDVWFIDDKGNVTVEEGTYANGHVTFTATHFSYYTVTRLTPEQRCAKYGHNAEEPLKVKPTCTEAGYDLYVCARCNETWKDNEVAATGHTLKTETTAATCTTAGKTVVTCENCDYKSTSTTPATGHKWAETTEEATCKEAKKVSVGCTNPDCTATKEIVLAQLAHDTETTSVPATCQDKAYDLTECKNCDYEVKEFTGAAKGHNHAVTWTWDEKALTVVATYTCQTEGCKDTFNLDATVTIEKELPASCEEDGYIDYVAKVVYNAKVKTDTYRAVIPATGHNTSAAWENNALQHYHVCTICGAKLEAADHTFDSTVTKEPTCTETGTKLYTCTACAYEKTESIPAKGHNYGDDHICDSCGHSNLVCDHDVLHVEEVVFDKDKGFCGGSFSYETCDCEKVNYFYGYDFHCDFEEEMTIVIDENGYVTYNTVATCKDCGLQFNEYLYWVIDEDACMGTMYMNTTIKDKSDTVLVDFDGIYYEDVKHPNCVRGEADDVSKYGMCDGTVTKLGCACGTDTMLELDLSCHFVEVPDECGEGITTKVCDTCGVTVVQKYGTVEIGQCKLRYDDRIAFYKDGKELVAYTYSFELDNHDSEYIFDLAGDTCSDGYTVHEKCKVCGYDETYFEKPAEGQHYVYPITIDVSKYDLCTDEIVVWTCPCEEITEGTDVHGNHRFETVTWDDKETDNGYVFSGVEKCLDCELERKYTEEVTYTGNGCEVIRDYNCTYMVGNDVIFTEKERYLGANHDYNVIGYELKGNSCEDGVLLTYECSECDYVETQMRYYHECFVLESYNAADYGMCDGQINVRGCACGRESWIEENTACNWEHLYYNEATGAERFECTECGIINDVIRKEEAKEGCQVHGTVTYEYIDGATVVLKVERDFVEESHDFEYTFDIAEGASCDDGFTVNMKCRDCDVERSWKEEADPGEHVRYQTQTYDMSEYGLCGGYMYLYECPCGGSSGLNWNESNCEWNWASYDEETDTTIFKCMKCGGTRHLQEKEGKGEGCYVEYTVTNTFFDKAGKEVLSVTTEELYGMHDFEITFDIEDGATCSDGYKVIHTCKDCNEVFTYYEEMPEGQHERYCVETYDLTEYGFCGGEIEVVTCACGELKDFYTNVYEYCNFEWVEDAPTGEECRECMDCGAKILSTYDWIIVDPCHDYEYETFKYYAPDGKFVTEVERTWNYESHDDICTFVTNGSSCEDGYTVTLTCQTCGEVRQRIGFEHDTYRVAVKEIAGICGGYIETYRCACGQEEHVWSYQNCSWNMMNYDDQTKTWTYECSVCGATKTESMSESEKDANCKVYRTWYYKIYDANDKLVVEYSTSNEETLHDMITTFNMQGTSCEDGYYVIQTCKDCGYTWQNSMLHTDHSTWCVETVDLADKGLCGGTLRHYKCPCGENNHWGISDERCNWSWDGMGMNTATCTVCGTTRTCTSQSQVIDACHDKYTDVNTYTKDGVVVFSYTHEYTGEHHDVVFTLTLMNPDGDCYGGYVATGTCDVCHEDVHYEGYGHNAYVVEKTDLSDDGLCPGSTVKKYACACGLEEFVSDGYMDTGCHWNYWGATGFSYEWKYDVISAEAYKCYDYASAGSYSCGAIKKVAEVITGKDENCNATIESITVYYNAQGDVVYAYESSDIRPVHNFKYTGVVMNDPNDCEAGYYEVYECEDCGQTSRQYNSWHNTRTQAHYDLAEYGGCADGYVEYYSCHCGDNQYVNYYFPNCYCTWTWNDYTDDNGVNHSVRIGRCENCDLMFKEDTVYEHDVENCMETRVETITITVKDVPVCAPFVVENTYTQHSYTQTVALVDGATSCEDGVMITNTCKYCDYTYTEYTNWHQTVETERYDLADYGSACGGYLVVQSCACGENNYVNLYDTECDLDVTWIKDTVVYSQYTTEGYNNYWHEELLHKCAVTEPDCDFAAYQTRYHVWDEANCEMVTYTSWKLGYDDVTGNYDKEVIVITDRNAYHAYETTTSADGDTTTGVCKHCGSSYVDSSVYDENGNLMYREESAINTLDNGEPQSRSKIREYVNHSGYIYQVKDYNDITYADGSTWWIHYDYEYDWSNCTCVRTMTDSYGSQEVYEVDGHKGNWRWAVVEEPTCSQPGLGQYVKDCPVCGQTVTEPLSEIEPSHNWYWNGSIYECLDCGLESINGAIGSIIFEDMSAEYGNGTDYVIGYYQRNNVRFSYELLVVLGEHEIPLTGISYKELTKDVDGITAITFNKADAEAAAIAALNAEGVTNTDGFALRFVFIPDSSDGDFDYAITLTDESIAE